MAGIITGLYKHHAHASLSAYIEGMIHECAANAFPLVNGIHCENIHLAHAVLRMQPGTYPTHQLVPLKSDRYVLRLTVKNSCQVAVLTFLPTHWVEGLVDKARHRIANQWKHRFPGS